MQNDNPFYAHHILLIRSTDDGRLGCFHFLTIMNNTAAALWTPVFISLEYTPREWNCLIL